MERVIEKGGNIGFDAYHMKYVDMFEAGIIDPTKVCLVVQHPFYAHRAPQVIRTALQDASGVASLVCARSMYGTQLIARSSRRLSAW